MKTQPRLLSNAELIAEQVGYVLVFFHVSLYEGKTDNKTSSQLQQVTQQQIQPERGFLITAACFSGFNTFRERWTMEPERVGRNLEKMSERDQGIGNGDKG